MDYSIDYLSPERLKMPADPQYTYEQVKMAALSLMIDPNDIGSRMILSWYARPEEFEKSDSLSFAIQSRFATRIARAMLKYDRERGDLRHFLRKVFVRAEQDVYYQIKKIIEAEEKGYKVTVGDYDGIEKALAEEIGVLSPLDYDGDDGVDYNEKPGFSEIKDIEILAQAYLDYLVNSKPFGETIKRLLFQQTTDGIVTTVLLPEFRMSDDELSAVIKQQMQNEQRKNEVLALFRPHPPALNPAVYTPMFEEFYAQYYTPNDRAKSQQNLYVAVFKNMILGKYNPKELKELYVSKYKEQPPIRVSEARYGNRARGIFIEFLDQCIEDAKKAEKKLEVVSLLEKKSKLEI
jgi:hypothetical protein